MGVQRKEKYERGDYGDGIGLEDSRKQGIMGKHCHVHSIDPEATRHMENSFLDLPVTLQ